MGDQQINLLLVGEVEKYPILYNFHLPGYSRKHETEKAWADVGNVVKLTAVECKDRWKNIRAVFTRHMKPSKSGSRTKEMKPYYLSEAMQFTVPYIRALGTPSGYLSQSPLAQTNLEDVEGDRLNDDILSEPPSPTASSPRPSPSNSLSCSSGAPFSQPQPQDHQSEPIKQPIPNRKKRPASYNQVDKSFNEYLDRKNASSKREQLATQPREEALKMYLLSMLPDLMKMDDREVRQFKRKTLDAVDDIFSARSSSTRPPSSCPSQANADFSESSNEMSLD